MIQVNVLDSGMVRPAADTPRRRLWLSDLDLIMREYHVPCTYFYCRRTINGLPDFLDMADRLKDSLSKVLVQFYPVAGRLAIDGSNRFEIDCNGEGALFVVAQAENNTIDEEFGDFSPSKKLMHMVPRVDRTSTTTQDAVSSFPLFLAQVTHFKCGGVCLGIAFHHFVADGPGAMHMINSWAELCRGLDHISIEPFIDRDLLHSRKPPTPSFSHTREYPPGPLTSSPGSKAIHDQISSDTPPMEPITELLEISPDLVNRLKASAPGYTTFEALAAHIWRCTCKARRIPADTESNIRIPVNGRARLRPPLPLGFFGNSQFRAMATATVGDLTSNGALSYAAGMIHAGVVRVDDEYMRSSVDYLAMQPDMELLRGWHLKGADVKVTSWAGMGVEGANFGWGQASFMGRGRVEAEGHAYLVPSLEKGKATYLLSISLQRDHMVLFKRLFFQVYPN